MRDAVSHLPKIPRWQQGDPRFNEAPAWPESEFPEAELHYMKEAGCLVTSLATLLRMLDIEKECDDESFNPWILNERLKAIRAFTPSADLEIDRIRDLYPIELVEVQPFDPDALSQFLESGQPCLVSVRGADDQFHFVVPTGCEDGDFTVIDSGWGKAHLSEFERALEIYRFARMGNPTEVPTEILTA